MKSTPSQPPMRARKKMREYSRSKPKNTSAGRVKITPDAMDWPAFPVVWTMLFSRIEASEPIHLFNALGMGSDWTNLLLQIAAIHRRMLMESTAMGMEAATVRPARRPT